MILKYLLKAFLKILKLDAEKKCLLKVIKRTVLTVKNVFVKGYLSYHCINRF